MLAAFPTMSPVNSPDADFTAPNIVCTIPSESRLDTLFMEMALNAEFLVSQ